MIPRECEPVAPSFDRKSPPVVVVSSEITHPSGAASDVPFDHASKFGFLTIFSKIGTEGSVGAVTVTYAVFVSVSLPAALVAVRVTVYDPAAVY